MSEPLAEPATDAEMAAWVAAANEAGDRFNTLRADSDAHRMSHGCDLYPSADGPLLAALARLAKPARLLEVGCGLGYSALCLAEGAGSDATVETIENDPVHVELARRNIERFRFDNRVAILEGSSSKILPRLTGPYDLAFFDGDPGTCMADLLEFERLVPAGGTLISSNLFLGRYVPGAPWLSEVRRYRERLIAGGSWRTVFLAGGKALSTRVT